MILLSLLLICIVAGLIWLFIHVLGVIAGFLICGGIICFVLLLLILLI